MALYNAFIMHHDLRLKNSSLLTESFSEKERSSNVGVKEQLAAKIINFPNLMQCVAFAETNLFISIVFILN